MLSCKEGPKHNNTVVYHFLSNTFLCKLRFSKKSVWFHSPNSSVQSSSRLYSQLFSFPLSALSSFDPILSAQDATSCCLSFIPLSVLSIIKPGQTQEYNLFHNHCWVPTDIRKTSLATNQCSLLLRHTETNITTKIHNNSTYNLWYVVQQNTNSLTCSSQKHILQLCKKKKKKLSKTQPA